MSYRYENMLPDVYEPKKVEVSDFYMDINDGQVQHIEDWEEQFENRDDKSLDWFRWGGRDLIPVVLVDGVWSEYA